MRGVRVGIKPNTSPWLAWRAQGITATDVAAILGLSSWASSFSLWWRKAGDRAAVAAGDVLQEMERSQRWELGHRAEPLIEGFYRDEVLPEGHRIGSGGCWQQRGPLSWARATPDRVLYKGRSRAPYAVLEFKTDAGHGFGEDNGDGLPEIPVYYRAQVLWEMAVVGVDVGWLSVLTGRMEIKHYKITPQTDEIDTLIGAAWEFQRSLDAGEPPDVDDSEHTTTALKTLHTGADGEADVDGDTVARWREVTEELGVLSAEKTALTNALLAQAGDAKTLMCDGQKVATRSVFQRKATDHDAVKAALESLAGTFPFSPHALATVAPKPTITLRPTKTTSKTATPIRRRK